MYAQNDSALPVSENWGYSGISTQLVLLLKTLNTKYKSNSSLPVFRSQILLTTPESTEKK